MSEHGLAQAIQTFKEAFEWSPIEEVPGLLGELERLKALGWARLLTGPQNGHGEDELLDVPQVAARLKLSRYRTYELCRQGILKSIKLGKSVRVKPSAVAEYVAQQGA